MPLDKMTDYKQWGGSKPIQKYQIIKRENDKLPNDPKMSSNEMTRQNGQLVLM
jgi:hypothetical protein